jgi:hypothetical protein
MKLLKRKIRWTFLSELSRFCSSITEPTLIGGDFNINTYAKEKKK